MDAFLSILAQAGQGEGPSGAIAAVASLIYLVFVIAVIAAVWKIFTKASQPGWAAIIPIYNVVVLLKVVGRPLWWLILFLIPFVNFIAFIVISLDLAKSFGKGVGFAIGLILLSPIFLLILGFGDARYSGPSAS